MSIRQLIATIPMPTKGPVVRDVPLVGGTRPTDMSANGESGLVALCLSSGPPPGCGLRASDCRSAIGERDRGVVG